MLCMFIYWIYMDDWVACMLTSTPDDVQNVLSELLAAHCHRHVSHAGIVDAAAPETTCSAQQATAAGSVHIACASLEQSALRGPSACVS